MHLCFHEQGNQFEKSKASVFASYALLTFFKVQLLCFHLLESTRRSDSCLLGRGIASQSYKVVLPIRKSFFLQHPATLFTYYQKNK